MSRRDKDRFKLGDVVVHVVGRKHHNPDIYGIDLTIDHLDEDGAPRVTFINKEGKKDDDYVDDVDCELKHVATSPLYKALG